ncbi:hypothetical protein [Candidatus Solirubrobacter pratensis]|uniref:hypothetical protein n=1 Tax=Candidatus Solirubrobacter pratensis TaxID=1298857 RepID=UPI0004031EA5|nr:hypothetical protein [Candidatus Solirubrobacter pratensis]
MPGRYESWFLSARDAEPGRPPRALWIRHTRHRPAGAARDSAALWCTLFDADGAQAVKQSFSGPPPGAAGPGGFHGEARARGRMASWELTLSSGEPPLRHLRPSALYRLPLPRTKVEAPVPDCIASGRVVLDARVQEVVGWRATAGHNWGAEHADRWVWLHAAGFEDEPEAWLELTLARVRAAGRTTPWIANGALSLGGARLRLGGLAHIPGVRVVAGPGRLEAIVPGERADIRVAVHADTDQIAGFRYAGVGPDPVAGEREVLHAGLAEVHLNVRRAGRPTMELATAAGGAYELGSRMFTGAVALQPYPDP